MTPLITARKRAHGKGSATSSRMMVGPSATARRPRRRRLLDPATPEVPPMRILIAEDETIIRLDLRGALEAEGYEVREARDGAEAVELAREWQPDLAMLD